MKKLFFIFLLYGVVFGDYKIGEKIFKDKCSSCHSGYVSAKIIKDNFFNKDNNLLNLKAPTINMLVWAILEGPKKIGEDGDDFRADEIEEYLTESLYNPNIENSICDEHILKYYEVKKSLKGKVSEDDIKNITDYIMGYKVHHQPKKFKKLHLKDIDTSDILNKAKDENKLILIKVMAKDCYFCKKMDKEVFSLKSVQNAIAKDFIFVEVDIDEEKIPFGLAKKYQHITPSFFIIDGNKKLYESLPGSWNEKDFLTFLKENIDKRK